MTREELVRKLETRLGVTLRALGDGPVAGATRKHGEYEVLSPTNGAVLFTVSVFESDGSWKFGGAGSVLREHWTDLCEE